jgi:LmbE family N-acetylglucosaminyl deacetylase
MATLVCFHAHPDDESIATGGTMALAAEAGHDVVLVLATRGEHGEPVPGVLDEGEPLWRRRVVETHEAARLLGVGRVDFLDYLDSGMMGESTNDEPGSFWQADADVASERLAAILRDVGADVLTVYDDHGGYGHPDHIQVHRVGVLAAQKAGVEQVYQSTMNRDLLRRAAEEHAIGPESPDGDEDPGAAEARRAAEEGFGSPEAMITHAVDVRSVLDRKRAAMQAHASQIGPESFFLTMPEPTFEVAFGTEWYIGPGPARPDGAPFGPSILGDA